MSLSFPRSPEESKRQTAAITFAKLSSEDDPVQLLIAKLALGIVARAQFIGVVVDGKIQNAVPEILCDSVYAIGRSASFGFQILPRPSRKGSALQNLAGALHSDGVGCTLSVGQELKVEIPAKEEYLDRKSVV